MIETKCPKCKEKLSASGRYDEVRCSQCGHDFKLSEVVK